MSHWRYVRRSELRYIIAKIREARVIVNTFLPYELLFHKARLIDVFRSLETKFASEPEYEDALERTIRVLALFREIPDWKDESVVPRDSLLREFIGGSLYEY